MKRQQLIMEAQQKAKQEERKEGRSLAKVVSGRGSKAS